MDAKSPKDLHYYEPKNGHGLRHDPFNAIVAPRPIGWISSRGAKGNVNLAPYSFFNGFCYVPPIIGFSSTSWKDSVANIEETREFVWNLATMDLARQMNATAAHVARGISEFEIAGLTPVLYGPQSAFRPEEEKFLRRLVEFRPAVRLYREGRATGPPKDRIKN